MSHRISEAALKQMPKKPLNAYFKHRSQKLIEFKDFEDKTKRIKESWENLSQKAKKQLDQQFRTELQRYHKEMEAWKDRYQISEEDLNLYRQKPNKPSWLQEKKQEQKGQSVKAVADKAVAVVAQKLKDLKKLIPAQDEYRAVCEKIKLRITAVIEDHQQ